MKFLIAPNAFKNALSASDVAKSIARGLRQAQPDCNITELPLADGGDGTLECLMQIMGGNIHHTKVQDPLGREIYAEWCYAAPIQTAIIEMAKASGLALLRPAEYDPMLASTFGTGQLIQAAIDRGAKEIILGLGGSATVDGGLGCLQALGFEVLNDKGDPVPCGGQALRLIDRISPFRSNVSITILSDVKNVLLGPTGSAAVFGPQKGADSRMVSELEKGLEHFSLLTQRQLGHDMNTIVGGGAAGGIAAALCAYLNANIKDGANHIMDLAKVDDILPTVDYVITGEGKIDNQSEQGKAPYALAQLAKKFNKPVIALGGLVELQPSTDVFDRVICINKIVNSLEEAIANTGNNLARAAERLGKELRQC